MRQQVPIKSGEPDRQGIREHGTYQDPIEQAWECVSDLLARVSSARTAGARGINGNTELLDEMLLHHGRRFTGEMRIAAYRGVVERARGDGVPFREPSVVDCVEVRCDSAGARQNSNDARKDLREVVAVEGSCFRSLVVPPPGAAEAMDPHELLGPAFWRDKRRWCLFGGRVVKNRYVVHAAIDGTRFEAHHVRHRDSGKRGGHCDVGGQATHIRHREKWTIRGFVDVLHLGWRRALRIGRWPQIAAVWHDEDIRHAAVRLKLRT